MKKVCNILVAALLVVCMLAMTACSSNASSGDSGNAGKETEAGGENASGDGSVVIGYTCMDLTNPFHIAMRDTLKALAEADGYTFLEFDGASNQQKQNDAIDDFIAQGMTYLFLNPVDQEGCQPALEACQKAGVTVITVDSNAADTSLIATYISSDNYIAGKQDGDKIVELFPDGCNIAIMGNPLADSVVQRVAGLKDAIEGTKCVVVDEKNISTADAVLSTAEDILTANPDLQVFWGLNDDVSLIILGAVESANRQDEIKVMSVDGSPSGKTSVANGGLYCTAAQSPVGIAEQAYECFKTLQSGGTVEATYSLPTTLITPENVEENDPSNWK